MFCLFCNYEKKIADLLITNNKWVSTGESCTGGLISSLLTDVSGSSAFIKSNFVTYANEAKSKYIFVSEQTLKEFGAVSENVAKEMALGLIKQCHSDFALGITGIAGPTGGSKQKPVGLAYVGIANNEKYVVHKILMPKFLPRKLMKFFFAKKSLWYLYNYIRENIGE